MAAFPEQNRRTSWGVYDLGADMLASVAPGGQVIGLLGETTLVRYFRDVLGQRPDVEVVPADAEAARFAAVDAALAAGKPVYLTRDLPGAAGRYSLDAAGPLIAVSPKATPAPSPAGQPVGADVVLVEARTEVRHPHAGPVVRLALTWAAAQPISEELKVSARLVDAAGNVLVADDRVPVNFTYPTTAWVPGERSWMSTTCRSPRIRRAAISARSSSSTGRPTGVRSAGCSCLRNRSSLKLDQGRAILLYQ